ncbi:hypothetical protein LOTGIDRAFT_163220 [Lottia gigantea]|uniref:Uncharacterized protein n=1 Tax=Lottia gigantea TaxID=225164 RepID=V4A9Z4_LOTGI|nr:hypothetical protein LOTGIDRAFT_163220 [Lottia gigantea]ESO91860.1 hypothetical protein LOTGIDRAFT_163220 [Lottia gigantea]
MGNKFNHSQIFPNNPMLMCICGSSGSGKTHLTFNMLTTPNLLDFDSLYIYTTTPEQSYYQFLKSFRISTKERRSRPISILRRNEEEVEIKDILNNYIEGKKPTDIKVFLTKNVNNLDLSYIDSKRKNLILFDDCVAQRNQTVHNCYCIYQSQSFYGMDSMFIRKNANFFLLFELNDKDLSQIIQSINHGMDRDAFKKVWKAQWKNPDEQGYVFVNTRKPAGERSAYVNFIFLKMDNWNNILKRNREYIKAKNKIKIQVENNRLQQLGLTENLQTLFQPILKSQEDIKKKLAPKQIQQSPVPSIEYPIKDDEESDDYAEDYPPIIQEIDEDMVSGEGITFLSDNNEEILNRLQIILAAMKEGHPSHRQYN